MSRNIKITWADGKEELVTEEEYQRIIAEQERKKKIKQVDTKSQEIVPMTINLTRELRQKLQAKADADDRTLSSYIRKMLSEHVK